MYVCMPARLLLYLFGLYGFLVTIEDELSSIYGGICHVHACEFALVMVYVATLL